MLQVIRDLAGPAPNIHYLARRATEYLDDKQIEDDMEVPIDRFLLPKDLQEMVQERVKTFNNMAQAQMKLTAWDSAMASVRQVRPGQTA